MIILSKQRVKGRVSCTEKDRERRGISTGWRKKANERRKESEVVSVEYVGHGPVFVRAGVKSRGGGDCRENSEVAREDRGLHRLRWLRDVYKSMIKGLAGGVDHGRGVLGDSSEKTVGMAWRCDGGQPGDGALGGGSGEKGLFESIDDQTGPLASVRHPLTRLSAPPCPAPH